VHIDDLDRALAKGVDVKEYRIVRPDGRVRWIRERTFPVRNDDGEIYRIAGVAEDVTDRKEAEEILRFQKSLLRRRRRRRRTGSWWSPTTGRSSRTTGGSRSSGRSRKAWSTPAPS
jgi:hypothetical protein